MTKIDIKNYLEKIYNIRVAKVNTRIQAGLCCVLYIPYELMYEWVTHMYVHGVHGECTHMSPT